MLFVTINQHWVFLIICWYGVILGTAYKLGQIVCNKLVTKLKNTKHLTNSKKVKRHKFTVKNSKKHQKVCKICEIFSKNLIDFVKVILAGGIYIILNFRYNFGEIRLFSVIAYLIGLLIGLWIIKFIYKFIASVKSKSNQINAKL